MWGCEWLNVGIHVPLQLGQRCDRTVVCCVWGCDGSDCVAPSSRSPNSTMCAQLGLVGEIRIMSGASARTVL